MRQRRPAQPPQGGPPQRPGSPTPSPCSLRLPGVLSVLYVHNDALHVDGGVLDNLPLTALAREEGPLIAVSIGTGAPPASAADQPHSPRVPSIVDTLMRTMTIGSAMASSEVLAHADLAIHPEVERCRIPRMAPDRRRPRGRPDRNS